MSICAILNRLAACVLAAPISMLDGAILPPPPPSLAPHRCYNGQLYGPSAHRTVTDNKARVPPNSTVRFNFDAASGLVEVFLDGASQGVCFTGLAGMTVYPAIATYLSNRSGRLLRVERNCDFTIGTAALGGTASAAVASGVVATFDPARSLAANLAFTDGNSVVTSRNDTNSMAQTAEGFSRCNAVVEWMVTKDKRDDEGTCIGFSLSGSPTCFDYSKAESGLWYRCYNGV